MQSMRYVHFFKLQNIYSTKAVSSKSNYAFLHYIFVLYCTPLQYSLFVIPQVSWNMINSKLINYLDCDL